MANGQQQTPQAPQQTDLSDLRIHTLQQARAELPEVKATPPWEEEPTLPVPSTTKLGKAYDAAKSWLGEHEQHLSEKYLTPFRQGLDNMAEDLQQAGESGHTKSGGQLTTPARLLVEGTGALLKQVPVGRNVKETVQAMAVPPELPEAKVLSRELKAGERAAIDLSDLRTKQLTPNASGESEASLEAINRAKQEKLAGVSRVRIDTRSGKETPLIGPEAVDAKAGAYDRIVQRRADGSETTLAEGGQARPIAQKAPTAKTPATAKPEQKPNVYDLGEIEAKERRTTPGTSPTGMERRTLPLKGISGPPPEQVRLISEAKKQVAAAQTVPEMTAALNRLKNLTGTEAGLDIAQSGGEKLGEDIRKARAAKPAEPIARWKKKAPSATSFSEALKLHDFEGPIPSPEARRKPDKYKGFRSDLGPPKPYTNHTKGSERIRIFPDGGWEHSKTNEVNETSVKVGSGSGFESLDSHLRIGGAKGQELHRNAAAKLGQK